MHEKMIPIGKCLCAMNTVIVLVKNIKMKTTVSDDICYEFYQSNKYCKCDGYIQTFSIYIS